MQRSFKLFSYGHLDGCRAFVSPQISHRKRLYRMRLKQYDVKR